MARTVRIEYEGAVYHVLARGDHGQRIFDDDQDRRHWLQTLGEACEKTGWRIHAYVLMPNHYHLLLETPEANLVAGMKWLQGTYTQRYNARHHVFGHLYQGRYKALVIDGAQGNYFGVVSTYIHLNPARSRLIQVGQEPLSNYRWSSYRWYIAVESERPGWLITERVMGNLGLKNEETKGYEAYVEGRVLELGIQAGHSALEAEWKAIRRGWYLGDERFRAQLLARVRCALQQGRQASYGGPAKREHGIAEAERWLAQGLETLGVTPEGFTKTAKSMAAKQVLAWWLRQRTSVTRRWVSKRLGMGEESAVTRACRLVSQSRKESIQSARAQLLKGLMEI